MCSTLRIFVRSFCKIEVYFKNIVAEQNCFLDFFFKNFPLFTSNSKGFKTWHLKYLKNSQPKIADKKFLLLFIETCCSKKQMKNVTVS